MIQNLNPEMFTSELYQNDNGLLCYRHLEELFDKYIVGFCEGERLKYNPKVNQYAVMFEIFDHEYWIERYVEDRPNNRFWFHWPRATFQIMLKRKGLLHLIENDKYKGWVEEDD